MVRAWAGNLHQGGVTENEGYHMGGCQNYSLFLGPYYNTAPNI